MGATNYRPTLVQNYRSENVAIAAGHTTRPVRAVRAGASGSRIHQMVLTTNDAGANTVVLYHAQQMTLQSAMTVGAHVDGGGSSDTITRTAGSFITDGWKVGDLLFVHGSTTLANDFLTRITGVTATTLTFATGTTAANENLPTGAILYKASALGTVAVAANAGVSSGVPSIDLISPALFPEIDASPDRYRTLGPNNALLVAMGTVLGGSEFADVTTSLGDY